VAAGIPPAVEGVCLAAEFRRWKHPGAVLNIAAFFRRAGCTALEQAGGPPLTSREQFARNLVDFAHKQPLFLLRANYASMLTLVTTNPSKYAPFAQELERMRISLAAPKCDVPELQCLTFSEALSHKARAMAQMFGRPVLVDDAGLILEAYAPFPGPLTSVVLRSLGQEGLQRILLGVSNRAAMECHLGWWKDGTLRSWIGRVEGHLDLSRHPSNPRMLLSDLFVPDSTGGAEALPHRAKALAELGASALELHLEIAPEQSADEFTCPAESVSQCPFCAELEESGQSIFAGMIHERLPSRVLFEDDDFVVMPPIGQFIPGGLLVLSRRHILSFAYLPTKKFLKLEQLLKVIRRELKALYGVSPLIFEHGPAPERSKGVCCVDHAHLNIFPAQVTVHPHLIERMHFPLKTLPELCRLRTAEFGYLFVEENDGSKHAYDAQLVPTQLVRRIVTSQLGMPQRWHWRDYPGLDELVLTYETLQGKIRL
jgi:inosine/xanthosine triphosphate pyrophosphatase family protein/diadenosine tetraphosphate (Ap4A) HIT family hydrolase